MTNLLWRLEYEINVCYADAGLVDVTYTTIHAVGELVGWSDVGRGLGFDYNYKLSAKPSPL